MPPHTSEVEVSMPISLPGHSRASLTLDFYAHADEERDRKATDLFSSLIQSEAQQPKIVNL
jgi:hypothetical protein